MNNILTVLKFFKPKFYNTITWLVVGSGIGLIGSSLVEQIIQVFIQQFSLNITDGNDSISGLVLVFLGLVYHLLTQLIESRESGVSEKGDGRSKRLRESRKRLLRYTRSELRSDVFDESEFLQSENYSRIRCYLSDQFTKQYEPIPPGESYLVVIGSKGFRADLLEEMAQMERTWDLI